MTDTYAGYATLHKPTKGKYTLSKHGQKGLWRIKWRNDTPRFTAMEMSLFDELPRTVWIRGECLERKNSITVSRLSKAQPKSSPTKQVIKKRKLTPPKKRHVISQGSKSE